MGLAVVITVTFDKDVRTVNTNKLFEVREGFITPSLTHTRTHTHTHTHIYTHTHTHTQIKCDLENVESSSKPVKGRCTFDSKTQKAEFTPHQTLHPNATYTVTLLGHGVTTTQCLSSGKISNALITFKTCDPPPKNIGIKLKGHKGEVHMKYIHVHVCGESWLTIKDLQPTGPVLKAGHPGILLILRLHVCIHTCLY